jgi:phenylalanyl-tRNA synthetase alpha chain
MEIARMIIFNVLKFVLKPCRDASEIYGIMAYWSFNTNMDIDQILNDVKSAVQKAATDSELTELWREYLGKNGKIKDLMSKITEVSPEKRKEFGQQLNTLRSKVDEVINSAKQELISGRNENYLKEQQSELTFHKAKIGHKHPLTQTINEINRVFTKLGYSIYDGPEIETDEYLFQKCNLPIDHPARDLQDSIFIEEPNVLLRTQTSSVEARALEELEPPFKIVVPGRVYRNEKVNKSNHFLFHQYQLVCVQEKVSMTELFATVRRMFNELYGEDVQIRFRTKYYPEVEPGAGVDMLCPFCKGDGCTVCKMRGWLEMAGSGIIHPNMLRMAGLNPDEWQGFAFGFGLDRLAMTKHKIQDIRTLLGGNLAYKPHLGTIN